MSQWIKLPSGDYLNTDLITRVCQLDAPHEGKVSIFYGMDWFTLDVENAKAILAAMEGMTTESVMINTPYHLLMSKWLTHENVEAIRSSKNNLASVGDSIEDSYAPNVPPADTGDGATDALPLPNDPPAAG